MVEPPPVVEDMIGGGRLPRQARSAELGSRAQERPLRQEAGRGLVATGALCCRRAADGVYIYRLYYIYKYINIYIYINIYMASG